MFPSPPLTLGSLPSPPLSPPDSDSSDPDSPLLTPPLSAWGPQRVLLLLSPQRRALADPSDGGVPASLALRSNLAKVLAAARAARPPPLVVHVRHTGEPGDPDAPGAPGWELWTDVAPGEKVLDKTRASAFASTGLADWVPPSAEVVVVGLASDHDVWATCRDALRRKNTVLLIRGAHGTWDRSAYLGAGVTTPARYIEREVEARLEGDGVVTLDMPDVPDIFLDR